MELIFIPAPNLNREAAVSKNRIKKKKKKERNVSPTRTHTPRVEDGSSSLRGEGKLAKMARSGSLGPRFVNSDYVTAESWTVKRAER